ERRGPLAVRRGEKRGVGLRLVRKRLAEVAVETKHLARLIERIQHEPAQNLRDGMQAVFERRDDTEVAAAAPERPEEIGIVRRARLAKLAVRRHDVGRE